MEAARIALISCQAIRSYTIITSVVSEGIGLLRIRAVLINDDHVQLVERFEEVNSQIVVTKYSFHWQHPDGTLVNRWDNAPHHPELETFPHHRHQGEMVAAFPHPALDLLGVLQVIERLVQAPFPP